jgi:hypothetical protein
MALSLCLIMPFLLSQQVRPCRFSICSNAACCCTIFNHSFVRYQASTIRHLLSWCILRAVDRHLTGPSSRRGGDSTARHAAPAQEPYGTSLVNNLWRVQPRPRRKESMSVQPSIRPGTHSHIPASRRYSLSHASTDAMVLLDNLDDLSATQVPVACVLKCS